MFFKEYKYLTDSLYQMIYFFYQKRPHLRKYSSIFSRNEIDKKNLFRYNKRVYPR